MLEPLYTRSTQDKIRIWEIETDIGRGRYRMISGFMDGKQVTSEWTDCKPKNVGRKNATTAGLQAMREAEAAWKDKLRSGYFRTIEEAQNSTLFWPMLAQKYTDKNRRKEALEAAGVGALFSQPKLDGVRCIVSRDAMTSRELRPIVAVPHIHDRLKPLFEIYPDLVLDGELYNHEMRDDFNAVIRAVKKQRINELSEEERAHCASMQYWIYDCAGGERTTASFSERLGIIIDIVNELTDGDDGSETIQAVDTLLVQNERQIDARYDSYLEHGFEGQMLRVDGPYEADKRSAYLLKRKEHEDAEFLVLDIQEGVGNRKGQAGRVVVRDKQSGVEFKAGIKGNKAQRVKLLAERATYIGGEVTVQFNGRTPAKVPRFPRAWRWHAGKRAV